MPKTDMCMKMYYSHLLSNWKMHFADLEGFTVRIQICSHSKQEGQAMLLMEFCERGDLCKALQLDSNKDRKLFSWYSWDGPKKVGGLVFR